ncbi:MAG: DMT family transporter [Acidimicrobiales bacterium]
MPSPAEPGAEDQDVFTGTDWSLFIAIACIWGSSFLLIDLSLEGLTPGMVTLARVGSGAATLLVLRALGSRSRSRTPTHTGTPGQAPTHIAAEDRARVIAVSLIWVAMPFALFPMAQEFINSALTGLLNGATPIFVALVAAVMTGSRPRGALLFGLALGFVGVVVLSLPSLSEGSSEARGVLMVLAATVCYGVAMNLATPLQRRYGAVTLMTPILCLATVLLIPVGLRNWGDNTWEMTAVLPVLLLGIVGTGLAYWIMATLVGRAGAVRASFITYLIPVVSLILGVVLRGDTVAGLSLVGAFLTTVGALLASGRVRLPSRDSERDQALV